MSKDEMHYDKMVEQALRKVVVDSLNIAAKDGLPGDHHFYITFRTHAPGVDIADSLREKYPEEMTIVLQHQFWDLEIREDMFSVTLSFNKVPHQLDIPLAAITGFADPSVQFGLQFRAADEFEHDEDVAELAAESASGPDATADDKKDDKGDETGGDNVVTLDAFRKK